MASEASGTSDCMNLGLSDFFIGNLTGHFNFFEWCQFVTLKILFIRNRKNPEAVTLACTYRHAHAHTLVKTWNSANLS